MSNRTREYQPFPHQTRLAVWNKARVIPGYDENRYRLDRCGALIQWEMYGNCDDPNNNGWEIDHINPVSRGGGDNIENLQPLQWRNNRVKGDMSIQDQNLKDYCAVRRKI